MDNPSDYDILGTLVVCSGGPKGGARADRGPSLFLVKGIFNDSPAKLKIFWVYTRNRASSCLVQDLDPSLVCLPSPCSPHKGGELLVNHDGLQHVFDFSLHSGDTSRIQWAAFYSDCIHEVKPVLEGHRVTITYNIITSQWSPSYHHIISRRDSEDAVYLDEHFECSAESPSLTSKGLANVNIELKKIESQSSSPKVGFHVKHKYISKALQPHLLKGEDKTLFDYLVNKQWKCELKSILSRYQTAAIYSYGCGEDRKLVETHKI